MQLNNRIMLFFIFGALEWIIRKVMLEKKITGIKSSYPTHLDVWEICLKWENFHEQSTKSLYTKQKLFVNNYSNINTYHLSSPPYLSTEQSTHIYKEKIKCGSNHTARVDYTVPSKTRVKTPFGKRLFICTLHLINNTIQM